MGGGGWWWWWQLATVTTDGPGPRAGQIRSTRQAAPSLAFSLFPEGRACQGQGAISQPPREEAHTWLPHHRREGGSIRSLERLPCSRPEGGRFISRPALWPHPGTTGTMAVTVSFPSLLPSQQLRPASGNPPVLPKIVLGLTDLLTKETTCYTQVNNFNI